MPKDVITGAPQPRFLGPPETGNTARKAVCPCILAERPQCKRGWDCWHFDGKSKGDCDHCNNTGFVIPIKT
jgi:hypothetical protein